MKGSDTIYVLAVIFTFIIGLLSFIFLQLSSAQQDFGAKYQTLVEFLDMPKDALDKIVSGNSLVGSFSYVDAFETEDIIAITVKNSGDVPLSGFKVFAENAEILTDIAPDILYPQSKGIIVLDKFSNMPAYANKTITIKTNQNAEIRIKLK